MARSLDADILSTGFGELAVTIPQPAVQIAGVYGLLSEDVETFAAGTGSVAGEGGLFVARSGTGVGDFGVIRSERLVRYRPGQALRVRFTARFSPGQSATLQAAGAFTAIDGLWVGFNGEQFGVTRRVAGSLAVYRLTLSAGTGGTPETATVTLNGVPFEVALGAGLSAAQAAAALAASTVYTGWVSRVSPQASGAVVTFVQASPAATIGAFSLSSTGTAAGTFAQVSAGSPNDDQTGFVAQTAFNLDRLDGSADARFNASHLLLDPTALNVYEILIPYLGAGPVEFRIQSPLGAWVPFHTIPYPGSSQVPSQRNPAYRLGWVAASVGVPAPSPSLEVAGASAAGFVDGPVEHLNNPFAAEALGVSLTTTPQAVLALRVRGEFGGLASQVEAFPLRLRASIESANRTIVARAILNPTVSSGSLNFAPASAQSACDIATPTSTTVTGGRLISSLIAATGTGADTSFDNARIQPGDVLVITAATATQTGTGSVSIRWIEGR